MIDFTDPESNDWLAMNQFTVIEGQHNRRPDIVIFINGLPLGVIELKNAAGEDADIWAAFNQLQTYKQQISSLFVHNAVLVISDGLEARIGTISADKEHFMTWRMIDGEKRITVHSSSRLCFTGNFTGSWPLRSRKPLENPRLEVEPMAGIERFMLDFQA